MLLFNNDQSHCSHFLLQGPESRGGSTGTTSPGQEGQSHMLRRTSGRGDIIVAIIRKYTCPHRFLVTFKGYIVKFFCSKTTCIKLCMFL